jgi:hypothetical protein
MVLGQNESDGSGIDGIRGSKIQITCTTRLEKEFDDIINYKDGGGIDGIEKESDDLINYKDHGCILHASTTDQ